MSKFVLCTLFKFLRERVKLDRLALGDLGPDDFRITPNFETLQSLRGGNLRMTS